jgi:hypothetical protein
MEFLNTTIGKYKLARIISEGGKATKEVNLLFLIKQDL